MAAFMCPLRDLLASLFRGRGACLFETQSQDSLFRQIAENVGDVIWMTDDVKDVMLYVSPAYERIWGRTCESLYRGHHSWAEAIHEEDREMVRKAVRGRLAGGGFDIKYRIVRPDGSLRWILDRAFPVRDAAGRVYRTVGLARDITAECLAWQHKGRLAAIVEASDEAIVALTPDLTIFEWNQGAAQMFGYSRAEAIGQKLSILHPEERRPELDRAIEALNRGERWAIETKRRRKDGALLDVILSAMAIRDEQGVITGYAGIYRDITHRKHEEENRILRERERVQREIMAVLSHDLRTPLAAIKGFAETLRTGGLDDARRRMSFVRVIERQADKLARLVDNLLAQSFLEHGRRFSAPQVVGLRDFIAEQAAELEPILAKRHIALSLNVEPLTVAVDPAELSQVLQNLVDNAVKFTPRQGRVAVEARRDGEAAHVCVRDTGPGIPPADLERIFDRFERSSTSSHVKGTGLGLFIAKRIVEGAGGRIWAESLPGEGACMHFTLPLTEAAAQAQAGLI